MSGHSKWNNIKGRKEKSDAERSKMFTKIGREIMVAVKEGGAKGIMSAYNRIGAQWCGGCRPLLVDLLREEWGFDGFVITDASIDLTGEGYLDPALAVYARNSGILTMLYVISAPQTRISLWTAYAKDPIGMGKAMRLCVYDICKMKIQSNAFTAE